MKEKDTQYTLNKTLQFTVASRCSMKRNNDEILFPVWALKTVSTFGNYISKWLKYCSDNNISDLFQETYKDGILFLIESVQLQLWSHCSSTPSLNKYRLKQTPNNSLRTQMLAGFSSKASVFLTKYAVFIVLSYMENLPENSELLLELFKQKTATIFCFLSGQQLHTIHYSFVDYSLYPGRS